MTHSEWLSREPCKFPFNGFEGGRSSTRIWSLKGESGGTGFKAKREIIRAGPWRKAERESGERWRRAVEGQRKGRRREDEDEPRDARNKLQERGARMANGRDV